MSGATVMLPVVSLAWLWIDGPGHMYLLYDTGAGGSWFLSSLKAESKWEAIESKLKDSRRCWKGAHGSDESAPADQTRCRSDLGYRLSLERQVDYI